MRPPYPGTIMPPMIPPTADTPKPPTRFLVRYGVPICQRCQFAAAYCMCARAPAPDTPPEDGPAADSLRQRIAECKETK